MNRSLCESLKYTRETSDQRAGLVHVKNMKQMCCQEPPFLAPRFSGHGEGWASSIHTVQSPANRNAIKTHPDLRPGFRPAVGFKLIKNPAGASLCLQRKPSPALYRPKRMRWVQHAMLVATPGKPRSGFCRHTGVGRRLACQKPDPNCVLKSGDGRQNSMRVNSIEPIDIVNHIDTERPGSQRNCWRTTLRKRTSNKPGRSSTASPRVKFTATRQCRPAPVKEDRTTLDHSTSPQDEVIDLDKNARLCITLPSAPNVTSEGITVHPEFGC